jgi:hypothetical protein
MKIRRRIEALEKRRAVDLAGPPPVEFFDNVINGTATRAEWAQWTPWLSQNMVLTASTVHSVEPPAAEESRDQR